MDGAEISKDDETAGVVPLSELVVRLGPLLTSKDVEERLRGYWRLIAAVEASCTGPNEPALSSEEVRHVAQFVECRLRDHSALMAPTLRGILAVLRQPAAADDSVERLLQGLFQEGNCQACPLADRLVYYRVFAVALARFPGVVSRLGSAFALAVVQAMDGERDPRGLAAAFPLHARVVSQLGTAASPLYEDLFEVVACYFPIDFTPTSDDDKGQVSREELSEALRKCLSATPAFAPYCIPLVQEKLDSTPLSTKMDTVSLLYACLDGVYGNAELQSVECARGLFCTLRDEALGKADVNLSSAAVLCIGKLFAAAETPPIVHPCDGLLDDAFREWMRAVSGDAMTQDRLAAANAVWISALRNSKTTAQRLGIETFNCLVAELNRTADAEPRDILPRLACAKDLFHVLELSGLKDSDARERCFVTLMKLSVDASAEVRSEVFHTLGAFLPLCSDSEADLVVSYVGAAAVTETDAVALDGITDCVSCLAQLDRSTAGQTEDNKGTGPGRVLNLCRRILHAINKELEKRAASSTRTAAEEEEELPVGKECLWAVGQDAASYRLATDTLLEAMHNWAQAGTAETVAVAAGLLRRLWERSSPNQPPPDALPRLVAFASDNAATLARSDRLCEELRLIVEVILASGSCDEQTRDGMMRALVDRLLAGRTDAHDRGLSDEQLLLPPSSFAGLARVLEAFLACVKDDAQQLIIMTRVTDVLLDEDGMSLTEFQTESCCRLLAGLANRLDQNSLDDVITRACETVETVRERRFLTWCWLAWSVGHRNHHEAFKCLLDRVLKTVSSSGSVSPVCVRKGFAVLFREVTEGPLRPSTGASVNPLLRQKTLYAVLPELLASLRRSQPEAETAAAALVSILDVLPVEVLRGCQDQVIPSVVLSLQALQPLGMVSSLQCLARLLRESDSLKAVMGHVDTLVPRLLSFARFEGSMQVRMRALECLQLLADGPEVKVLPLKPRVLRDLKPSLGDRKRLVRKAAADASCAWSLLGEL
ncbi:unnamed protein product [Notodromas monacha]|uniref:MMS19 nucleotide excision repair protein n=1 Tax=Notodromas monacha TaxID=399045 RepID=A0A7R9BDG3_9CRUS|nr:unnamed protein product [Notodromas monacha]CAG0913360.1 unnamed protein product [Notodromas monacha]